MVHAYAYEYYWAVVGTVTFSFLPLSKDMHGDSKWTIRVGRYSHVMIFQVNLQ